MTTTPAAKPPSASLHFCSYETPVGQLSVVADPDQPGGAAIVAAGFCPVTDLLDRMDLDRSDAVEVNGLDGFDADIRAYLSGDGDALARIRTAQPGTALQQQVWAGLRSIPSGRTATYTELAAGTDSPRAVRAAGTACGRNLIAPFVPCHRAVRSDGSLGGYYYGLPVKRWLLELEGADATE